ncbi:FprA family A-type flavoprotein [Treponema pedis]|uniref:FprA family A-type flavoprotein n=1 Tax=Treponema pedis TaxID=409322 RepID=A0A7S6WQ55_9SPIR|nr:FprA family A-type flavoprotein [Treponema pedis]QOW61245.1 FprA family A-type flavoprotein [Treponema pedis]QSI04489.1 FprA family A-type flavoprotein [Treponema pedis]
MQAREIGDSVYCIHADIHERTARFEGLWILPYGVSINSYIIKGEKNALIDIVRDWDGSIESYRSQLSSIGLTFADFDYVILNHLEPDHADLIHLVRRENPEAEIIASAKGIAMVQKFFKINENLRAVKDGDVLDLGGGKVLTFYDTPNIHWPETMMTYDTSDKILFSCDAFGSYGCIGEKIFDTEHTEEELKFFENEALRYYSNIVASFSTFVNKGAAKLDGLEIKIVAPSHGILWKGNPLRIINLYKKFAGYNTSGEQEKAVCIIWGSMYGYTKAGLDAVIEGIDEAGMPYSIYRIPDVDPTFILGEAYRSAGLVLAMPTYEYKMFPPMAHILDLFERKHFTGKKVLRIGNWGWVGGAKKEYEAAIEKLNWTNLESYEWQGRLGDEDKQILKLRGKELAEMIKGNCN